LARTVAKLLHEQLLQNGIARPELRLVRRIALAQLLCDCIQPRMHLKKLASRHHVVVIQIFAAPHTVAE